MTRTARAWALFLATRLVGVAVDALTVGVAYLAAFALRLNFNEPSFGWRKAALSYLVVLAVYLAALFLCGCYRLAWRRIRISDLPRYFGATCLACVLLTLLRVLMPDAALAHMRPPYSVTLISFFLATVGIVGLRVLWRAYLLARRNDEELLARAVRHFDNRTAVRFLAGKCVMVTGAGGSIGGEIVRQVAAAGARKILMVERGENALYEIDREMRARQTVAALVPLMVDVNDRDKMAALLAAHRPEVILHAAAYKHVPMCELNPEEAWRNNTEATRALAELAAAHGVRRFVLISTDKAVNPVSVMGKTKRAAEEAIMSLNSQLSTLHPRLSTPNSHLSTFNSQLSTLLLCGALRQRLRLVGLGRAALPRADRPASPRHRDASRHEALLHDDRGGRLARPPGRLARRARHLHARHGRAGEDPRPRRRHDRTGRLPALRRRADRLHGHPPGREAVRGDRRVREIRLPHRHGENLHHQSAL
ncbi:MAG: polysaccharide biosynthesis protein [Kiritimatiellae bacterium]|nr:polysaccharide biosynthesis protein [Kiritimatiellia bacterium]